MPIISVIIPTFKRPNYLYNSLVSIADQVLGVGFFEIIVIDNASDGETEKVVEDFKVKTTNLRYVREPLPGLHNARHRGLREAKSELLAFVDDDIEACPGWLKGVWEGFTRHGAALVGGRNLPRWGEEPPSWLMRLWRGRYENERSLGFLSILDFGGEEREIDPSYVWGCNFSIRKSVLLEAGGFHPDSMPEGLLHLRGDGESYVSRFIAERGYKTVYMPSASVYHFVPKERMSLDYFRKRAFSQGVSDSYTQLRKDPSRIGGVNIETHPLACLMANEKQRSFWKIIIPGGIFVRANISQAYCQGFMWHNQRFMSDRVLRNWVLRETYLDN